MKYLHTLLAFLSTPWAIEREKYEIVRALLLERAAGIGPTPEQIEAATDARRTAAGYTQAGKVAIIPIMGVIAHRVGMMERSSGGISTEAIGRQVDAAVEDKTVSKIVLQIDSPGGSVAGVTELAAKIRAAREEKKVIAVADATAASAAYWLGSQASEFYATPSGRVGSIGVIAEHVDDTAAREKVGYKSTLITAGKYKGEGYGPLTDEAAQRLQADVDHYYDLFVSDVAKGRGVSESAVRNGYGEGRALVAAEAKAAGMIDGIASFETVLRRLSVTLTPEAMRARARAVEIS
jgi:signal peptide peptidase SppA